MVPIVPEIHVSGIEIQRRLMIPSPDFADPVSKTARRTFVMRQAY
jgi:hypothetical protein